MGQEARAKGKAKATAKANGKTKATAKGRAEVKPDCATTVFQLVWDCTAKFYLASPQGI